MKLLFGHDAQLLSWAAARIPHLGVASSFGPASAIGVVTEFGMPSLVAVVVFHTHVPEYKTCQLSVASEDPRWATKSLLRQILAVPFVQYECNKAWSAVPHKNVRVAEFAEAIGFTREGTLKDQFGPGTHAIMLRMLADDYDKKYLRHRVLRKAA